MRLSTNYGAWSTRARTHIVVLEPKQHAGDTAPRLCDGKESIFNMGYAGGVRHVTCSRCIRKLKSISDWEEVKD